MSRFKEKSLEWVIESFGIGCNHHLLQVKTTVSLSIKKEPMSSFPTCWVATISLLKLAFVAIDEAAEWNPDGQFEQEEES
jgi:hypothetical protein